MARNDRIKLIKNIEQKNGSRLIAYLTGDRRGLEAKISFDVFPMFHRHLMEIGHQKRIDLFLYSTGGITIAGYALVNLIREFCDEFAVIIPFKALSCATLISLGANEIIMSPMGQLSPIDPSFQHPLGPVVQFGGQQKIAPVSVEDINAFVDLAKKEIGLTDEDSMKKVLELLATKIHPLVLGAAQRGREQIEFLAKNLMKHHCINDDAITQIVSTLIRERFSHQYIMSRKEAKETLGLNIIEPDNEFTETIVELFNQYNEILELNIPFNPETVLGSANSGTFRFDRALIESVNHTHVFRSTKELSRIQIPPGPGMPPMPVTGYQEKILQEEWIEDKSI